MIKQILLVGGGGAAGSIFRFLISEFTRRHYTYSFPLATFIINITGCFIIGLLVNTIPANNNLKLLLIVGFCGGFTTFSAFSHETFHLIDSNHITVAVVYTISSCLIGLCAVWFGIFVSK